MSYLELENLTVQNENRKIFDQFSADYKSGQWVHFLTGSPEEAAVVCGCLASYHWPDKGQISWEEKDVFADLKWYRSRLLSFDSHQDLFDRLTVRANLQLYADFFSVESTVDKKILGFVDQDQYVCFLDSYQISRLKLSILMFISRPLFFYANPFVQLNPGQQSSVSKLFKRLVRPGCLLVTAGTVPAVKADTIENIAG